jgi:phosphoribosylglycinamide formyltransferase-1
MIRPFKIALFASGNGTNAEAIIKHFQYHNSIEVALILSNNKEAKVHERALKFNIPSFTFSRAEFMDDFFIISYLEKYSITHVVLAGFMWLIPAHLVKAYPNKIINIHPALLPKFGGKGMYGRHVHEAIKLAGENVTGITIHLVNEHYDEGTILLQKSCAVTITDSAEDIAHKVHQLEYEWYPVQIEKWITKTT